MRKLILASFLVACICAYPQKYNFNVHIDEIHTKNIPNVRKEIYEKLKTPPKTDKDWTSDCLSALLDPTIIDVCADDLFGMADTFLGENYQPLDLPEEEAGFSYDLGIITFQGDVDIRNGKLNDLSTMHRNGDVQLTEDLLVPTFSLVVPLAFNDLSMTYDYSAEIMDLGPSGGIEASVSNIQVEVGISYDQIFTLTEFNILDSGDIDVTFTGNSVLDWLLNLLLEAVTALLKKTILNVLQGLVHDIIQGAIDNINESIANGDSPSVQNSLFSQELYKAIANHKKL